MSWIFNLAFWHRVVETNRTFSILHTKLRTTSMFPIARQAAKRLTNERKGKKTNKQIETKMEDKWSRWRENPETRRNEKDTNAFHSLVFVRQLYSTVQRSPFFCARSFFGSATVATKRDAKISAYSSMKSGRERSRWKRIESRKIVKGKFRRVVGVDAGKYGNSKFQRFAEQFLRRDSLFRDGTRIKRSTRM